MASVQTYATRIHVDAVLAKAFVIAFVLALLLARAVARVHGLPRSPQQMTDTAQTHTQLAQACTLSAQARARQHTPEHMNC